MAYSGLSPHEAVFKPGREVRVGKITIPLDEDSHMLISFNGPEGTFRSFSYQDVMNDKVSPDAFAGKGDTPIVLAVSEEPKGGSPTGRPTGPVIAAGRFRPV